MSWRAVHVQSQLASSSPAPVGLVRCREIVFSGIVTRLAIVGLRARLRNGVCRVLKRGLVLVCVVSLTFSMFWIGIEGVC